jgi:adenylate cyclase
VPLSRSLPTSSSKATFDLERVGEYPVRGFNDPTELFAHHG